MATVVIAGLAGAIGAAATGAAIFGLTGIAAIGAAFAIGAGLSLVSQALMPSPNLGSVMGGRSITTRDAATSRKIVYGRARIGGNIVYLESTGTDNKYLWLVIAVAGHEIDAYEEVWFNDVKIWDGGNFIGGWGNYVSIGFHKGDQTTADSGLNAASTKWTSDHKLLDTAYMVVKLTYDIDQFANGLPNISTVIRGKKVLNPATSTTAWSQNPALCVYDYLRDTKYGLGESASNILTSSITAAATVCDETVALAAGGTQPRYTIDGVVDTEGSIKNNLDAMLGSMIGRLVFSAGKFEIYAGEYVAPAYSIDESVAVGDISIQTKQSRRNAYNGVKGVFLSEDDNYILADYPAQLSSTFAAEDGDPIYLDMPLPFTVNNIRAQRIAKLALFRSRQQEAITIPCNLSALRFKIGDNINVTNARLGYSNKVFEVVGYSLDFTSEGQIVVNVDAIETAASIWDWTTSDEEVYLGAGEVALYDGLTAAAPTNLSVTGDSFLNSDGTFNAEFNVAWTNADDAFTDHYVVEWKLNSASSYYSMTTKSSPAVITTLQNGQTYNVRVKAINEIGVSSSYVAASPTAATDTTAPSVPSSVSATGQFEAISVNWTNPTASDFSHVDVYQSTSSGGTYALVGKSSGTSFVKVGLSTTTTYYYKVKAVDFTGNQSAFSGVVSATTTAAPAATIPDGSIDTIKIADDAITNRLIDTDAVNSDSIAANAVTAVKIDVANLSAISADIGTITAGSIDGVTVKIGTGTSIFKADTNGIYLGNATFGSAPFRVTPAGAITATSATITGDITANNIDGSTITYNGGNLQVGSIGTGNINSDAITNALIADDAVTTAKIIDDAVTNALIATNAVNQDSIAANSVTASEIVSGTITSSEIAANTITAANVAANTITAQEVAANTITALQIASNTITASQIAANTITASQIAANTLTAAEIQASSITVDKLSGDVSELYPTSVYANTTITSTPAFTQQFYIPAPSLSISKRQRIDMDFDFEVINSSGTDYQVEFAFGLQVKSKSATGVQVGSAGGVTLSSNPFPYNWWIYLSGNYLSALDNTGGVANNSSGTSNGNINSVFYHTALNRTYIMVSASNLPFATGDTLYFNPYRFAGVNTYVDPASLDDIRIHVPAGTTQTVRHNIAKTYGESTTTTEFRPEIVGTTNITNVTAKLVKYSGTMENVS